MDVLAVLSEAAEGVGGPTDLGLTEACAAVSDALAALRAARSTLATALRVSAPDLFCTDEDVASHMTIKRIDAALTRCGVAP